MWAALEGRRHGRQRRRRDVRQKHAAMDNTVSNMESMLYDVVMPSAPTGHSFVVIFLALLLSVSLFCQP